MRKISVLLALVAVVLQVHAKDPNSVLVEAESFIEKGGWVVDQQFSDLMGSSYLMAHGMGSQVNDAKTEVIFSETGKYRVFVRTYNWTSPWFKGEGPGKFRLSIEGKQQKVVLGAEGSQWTWHDAGTVLISKKKVPVVLHDLTGFDGRCDAIYFTKGSIPPPNDLTSLSTFRKKMLNISPIITNTEKYDMVVVGGGIAGICAAISSARLGLKVALVHDRPVLGGNNSSEVRVHLGGQIKKEPYPALGDVVNEIGPLKEGNAKPAEYYEDEKKLKAVMAEPNIKLFLNYRAFGVEKKGKSIASITAKNIETGKELNFSAPFFADCTGDGTIGFLSGADFSMGRESQAEYGETTAPETADKMTMGASVQWYSEEKTNDNAFPIFQYGVAFNDNNAQKIKMGEWHWETGMNFDQIKDYERIRDYGLLVVYSNWSFMKNFSIIKGKYTKSALKWVAYVAGKRESRRLLGDFILKEQDITNFVIYPDASVPTTWSIDLHYPDPKNTEYFPREEFKSIARHIKIHPYPIPYRCLYSRNVDNLFMAGRNISVTHVALGTVRVMRTTGMMGEVVGMAASLGIKHQTSPRGVYEKYLDELKALMKKGVGKGGAENLQKYNLGGFLEDKIIAH
ncbi:MAG: FAD-dependent oxidoreductase [Bacteroidales bacterium]|nr:FAD-dependent oxidoreductase [Bacteroidales bacterium]